MNKLSLKMKLGIGFETRPKVPRQPQVHHKVARFDADGCYGPTSPKEQAGEDPSVIDARV